MKKIDIKQTLEDIGIKPSTIGFGIVTVIALIHGIPSYQEYRKETNAIKADVQALNRKTDGLRRELESEKEQAAIANERYAACLPVVGRFIKNGTHYFTSIQAGDTPVDRISGKPIAPGTIVCDAGGMTGVVNDDLKIASLAYTGDRDIVQKDWRDSADHNSLSQYKDSNGNQRKTSITTSWE